MVVLGVRGDDPVCNKVQSAAELTNRFLLQRYGSDEDNSAAAAASSSRASPMSVSSSSSSTADKYRMVKVNFAEHQATSELYGVKALPAFLMFQGGRLAWAGTLGGSPVKAAPPDALAAGQRVLLVEPCAKVYCKRRRTGEQETHSTCCFVFVSGMGVVFAVLVCFMSRAYIICRVNSCASLRSEAFS